MRRARLADFLHKKIKIKSIIAERLNLILILELYNKDKEKAATIATPRRKQHE
jgi:hypothetical protein